MEIFSGEPGLIGPPGNAGKPGNPGLNGVNGKPGARGKRGKRGKGLKGDLVKRIIILFHTTLNLFYLPFYLLLTFLKLFLQNFCLLKTFVVSNFIILIKQEHKYCCSTFYNVQGVS